MECKIDLSTFVEGDIKDISVSMVPDPDLATSGRFIGDITLDGWVVKQGDNVLMNGNARYSVSHDCDLCGEAFTKAYDTKVSATFSEHPEEDEFPFDGVTVDLSDAVREAVILAFPSRLTCKDDCKGLCPKCGVNLNNGECSCCESEEEDDNPFSLLKKINFTGGASNGSTKE